MGTEASVAFRIAKYDHSDGPVTSATIQVPHDGYEFIHEAFDYVERLQEANISDIHPLGRFSPEVAIVDFLYQQLRYNDLQDGEFAVSNVVHGRVRSGYYLSTIPAKCVIDLDRSVEEQRAEYFAWTGLEVEA